MARILALIIGLLPLSLLAEHWLVQLPITTLATNSTATIASSIHNVGVVKGVYVDITGSESAIFTNTLYATSDKGDRTLYSAATATVSSSLSTNLSASLYGESFKLTITSPSTATNSVSVNAVVLYEK